VKRNYKVELSVLSKGEFEKILKKLDITKKKLSEDMGLSYQTVKSWYVKNNMPMYAEKYLMQALKIKKYEMTYSDIKMLKSILNKLDNDISQHLTIDEGIDSNE